MTILDLLDEVKTSQKYLHIRVDTDKDFDYHTEVWNIPGVVSYIIGKEIAPKSKKEHYHICLGITPEQFNFYTKQEHSTRFYQLATYIKSKYAVSGSQYSTSIARDSRTLGKYVLKEGDYIYKGYEESVLKAYAKCSYKKDKKQIQDDMNKLDEAFLTTDMTTLKYFKKYADIKTEYGQNINQNHMQEHLRILHFKRDPEIKKEWARYQEHRYRAFEDIRFMS